MFFLKWRLAFLAFSQKKNLCINTIPQTYFLGCLGLNIVSEIMLAP